MGISSVLTTVQYSTVQYSRVHSTVQDPGDGEQRKSSVLTTGSGLMLPLIFSPHRTSDTTQHSAHNRSYGHLLWQSFLGLNCHLYSAYRHFDSRYYFHTMHLSNLPEMLQSIILSFIFFIVKCFSILPYFIRCVELRAAEWPSVWLKGTVSTSHQHIQYWCYIWYLIFSFWMILFISFLYFSQNAFDIILKRSSHRTRECSKCSKNNAICREESTALLHT